MYSPLPLFSPLKEHKASIDETEESKRRWESRVNNYVRVLVMFAGHLQISQDTQDGLLSSDAIRFNQCLSRLDIEIDAGLQSIKETGAANSAAMTRCTTLEGELVNVHSAMAKVQSEREAAKAAEEAAREVVRRLQEETNTLQRDRLELTASMDRHDHDLDTSRSEYTMLAELAKAEAGADISKLNAQVDQLQEQLKVEKGLWEEKRRQREVEMQSRHKTEVEQVRADADEAVEASRKKQSKDGRKVRQLREELLRTAAEADRAVGEERLLRESAVKGNVY